MKTVGILQPGRLGDIIICLPIARYYADRGYTVIWPIFANFVEMIRSRAPYATFVPVTSNVYQCVDEARKVFESYPGIKVFDIAATFPGSNATDEYVSLGDGFGKEKFDEFKYRKCSVPFDYKWNLEYVRFPVEEDRVYDLYTDSQKYIVVGLNHSKGRANVNIETDKKIIELNEKHNIFDWIKVLRRADAIILVDSAMANIVDQLNLPNKKYLITKPGQPTPTFRSNWIVQ